MEAAGTKGRNHQQKLTIVKNYMQTAWNIDMDELRDVVQRRMSDVVTGEIDLETHLNKYEKMMKKIYYISIFIARRDSASTHV